RLFAVGNHGGIPAFLLLQLLFLAVGKVLGDGGLKQPPGKLCSADYQRQSPVFHFLLHRSSPPFHGFCRGGADRKSTRLNSSHVSISYAVFCLKKKMYGTCECVPTLCS